jgi:hypothetical protein
MRGSRAQKLDEMNFSSNVKFFPANPLRSLKTANAMSSKNLTKLDNVKLFLDASLTENLTSRPVSRETNHEHNRPITPKAVR